MDRCIVEDVGGFAFSEVMGGQLATDNLIIIIGLITTRRLII